MFLWSPIRCRLAAWLALALPAVVAAAPPSIRAVAQRKHQCGVASAETILRAYGDRERWTEQNVMAAALCARLPEFKHRRPGAADAIERYYPDFPETYQSELAEYLIDHGYCVVSTRSSIDAATGVPFESVGRLFRTHLEQGRLAVLHVPGHYLAATGFDADAQMVYFVDPAWADQVFSVPLGTLLGGKGFHTRPSGTPRPGWDGRFLAFWQGEPINQTDRCPVCRHATPDKQHAFCRTCHSFIDRRKQRGVQRALDTIAGCIIRDNITQLRAATVRGKLRRLIDSGELSRDDVRQALTHYPVAGPDPNRLETLQRYTAIHGIDCPGLSVEDLIDVICAGAQWRALLHDKVDRHGPSLSDGDKLTTSLDGERK